MKTVSIKDAKNRLTEFLRLAEAGERIVITRNGRPVADLVPHERKRGGLDPEGGRKYLESIGFDPSKVWIGEDFDDPLPEDFLITPQT